MPAAQIIVNYNFDGYRYIVEDTLRKFGVVMITTTLNQQNITFSW